MYVGETKRQPTWVARYLGPIGRAWLRLNRMQLVGDMPDIPKFIIVAAPHKSNWDLPHIVAAGLHYGVKIHWLGKASIFKFPFGGIMRWLGGIAVDRSKSNNAVADTVAYFASVDDLILAIPPEGTRSDVTRWKSGFYHIAVGAKVPLAIGFMDYNGGRLGIAQMYHPSGDYDKDLVEIQKIYSDLIGRPII